MGLYCSAEVHMITATVSGSFHRHMDAIASAVYELAKLSVRVLSPADPRIVEVSEPRDGQLEFLFVASDPHRSIKLVQDRHLDCITASDFLWLVCPDQYVGVSAAMEIGAARVANVPVFSNVAPSDVTLREYVTVVPGIKEAIQRVITAGRPKNSPSLLIDPHASIEEAHMMLERIEHSLTHTNFQDDAAPRVYGALTELRSKLKFPVTLH